MFRAVLRSSESESASAQTTTSDLLTFSTHVSGQRRRSPSLRLAARSSLPSPTHQSLVRSPFLYSILRIPKMWRKERRCVNARVSMAGGRWGGGIRSKGKAGGAWGREKERSCFETLPEIQWGETVDENCGPSISPDARSHAFEMSPRVWHTTRRNSSRKQRFSRRRKSRNYVVEDAELLEGECDDDRDGIQQTRCH